MREFPDLQMRSKMTKNSLKGLQLVGFEQNGSEWNFILSTGAISEY
jgi:hypothetical protein